MSEQQKDLCQSRPSEPMGSHIQTKHTPGPWDVATRQGSWDWVVYSAADPNTEICQPFHDGTEENEIGEANARLISAAPDLLDALTHTLRMLEAAYRQLGMYSPYNPRVKQARAAIAKAIAS